MDEVRIENESMFLLQNAEKICRLCLDLNQNNQCIFRAGDTDPENSNALDLVKKLSVQGGIEWNSCFVPVLFNSLSNNKFGTFPDVSTGPSMKVEKITESIHVTWQLTCTCSNDRRLHPDVLYDCRATKSCHNVEERKK